MKQLRVFWKNNKGTILFIFLILFYRSAVADWYHVPSGSMKPNILIGDRVWVDKLAYDVKIPMISLNLNRHHEPVRGDVVVFNSKASDDRLIKRVIGIPGDIVEMRNNKLFVNRKPISLEYVHEPTDFDAFLGDRNSAGYLNEYGEGTRTQMKPHIIRVSIKGVSHLSSFPEIKVPDNFLWVMGDNRDNSSDSRVIGMVPRSELVGQAIRVVISFDKNNYYLPRNERYWEKL